MNPAKTAEPIEMPFGGRTRVGPTSHVSIIQESRSLKGKLAILGVVRPTEKHRESPMRYTPQKINNDISATAAVVGRLVDVTVHCLCEKSTPCDAAFRQNFLTTCFNSHH